tara:strand:+ start:136 stop:423 length:288 start_codon:yes stop_codon:yes gene_type:complete
MHQQSLDMDAARYLKAAAYVGEFKEELYWFWRNRHWPQQLCMHVDMPMHWHTFNEGVHFGLIPDQLAPRLERFLNRFQKLIDASEIDYDFYSSSH